MLVHFQEQKVKGIPVKINHRRRIGAIIDAAPDEDSMKDQLAIYLIKNGKAFKNREPVNDTKEKELQILRELRNR